MCNNVVTKGEEEEEEEAEEEEEDDDEEEEEEEGALLLATASATFSGLVATKNATFSIKLFALFKKLNFCVILIVSQNIKPLIKVNYSPIFILLTLSLIITANRLRMRIICTARQLTSISIFCSIVLS